MAIGDLIDMDRACSNPDCQHVRGAHGGTYYKRDCGVVACVCKEFAEVRFTRNNTTWDGLVSEANRLDNQILVWKIRQKQTEDANNALRGNVSKLTECNRNQANSIQQFQIDMVSVRSENDALRTELAKFQEIMELMREAGKVPTHLGLWLLGEVPITDDITEELDEGICFRDC